MPGLLTKQPVKGLYVAYFIISTLAARLPFLCIYYIPRWLRQHPEYSYRTAIVSHLVSAYHSFIAAIEFRPDVSLQPGKETDRFLTIDPVIDNTLIASGGSARKTYVDICESKPHIKPATVGAIWYPEAVPNAQTIRGRKVIFHFHGGAYVYMTARDYGTPLRMMSTVFNDTPIFCPEYRLANKADGSTAFPAQLQDAITAYRCLLDRFKVPASSIIFSGDSAGAHLVLMLLRYITCHGGKTDLPPPAAAMLWSPWVDLAGTPSLAAAEKLNSKHDIVPDAFVDYGTRGFAGDTPLTNPYISPLQSPFALPATPVWVCKSRDERLAPSIDMFVESMREQRAEIKVYEVEGVPHDVLGCVELLGVQDLYEPALADAYRYFESRGVF